MENLLEKSRHNSETANFAEGKEFYDVAVSRYYYSLFEKIIYISKKEGFYQEPTTGQDSHKVTIQSFTQNMINSLEPEDLSKCAIMGRLKKMRVEADYKEHRISDKSTFNLSFKCLYNQVDEVLNKFI